MSSLAGRLGYSPDDVVVIISADGLGLCHSSNVAVYETVRSGLATGATLMVPCPWSREAAGGYRGEDIGVLLTLNSELDAYRWGPITQAPSLLDGDGGFPRTVTDLWDHADLDEARRECRSQVERAILWGFDATHLAGHLGALHQRPEFFDIFLELAVEFSLPLRLPGAEAEADAGFPFRRLAGEEGILSTDQVLHITGSGRRRSVENILFDLAPGVTELVLRPATDTPELRALDPYWSQRVEDLDILCHDSAVRDLLERSGARTASWCDVRRAQLAG